ncbi:MAG: ATP-dependent DNA helicase RecG [Lactobacillus sp.]|nr:ATP-dependent DNA helicase RecG [Lactobacillus sp.]
MSKSVFEPITNLKGVGKKTADNLATLDLHSVYDLIYDFPYRYDQLVMMLPSEVADGEKVVFKGLVATDPVVSRFGYKKTRLNFKLQIDREIIMINFFNQPWIKQQVEVGQEIAIYGKYDAGRQSMTAFKIVAKASSDKLSPIYSVNRHFRQKTLARLIEQAVNEYEDALPEVVPDWLREKFKLLSEQEIVFGMHYPADLNQLKLAERSAIFREFFIFQMQLAMLSQANYNEQGIGKAYDKAELKQLQAILPFTLSTDQKKAIKDILEDLASEKVMHRLLEGDVGSGKTVVALFAIYAAITAGYQVALLVPTEILASQHAQKLQKILAQFGVHAALLTGSTKPNEKKEILNELESGMLNLIIGTHALLEDNVIFRQLGLVIIDEQHRFGVEQRQKLINKGNNPDILVMTATPIPRTLALSVYGNLDVSEIHELPSGRKPVTTTYVSPDQLSYVFKQVRQTIDQGQQVYVVAPLISDSELDLTSAEMAYDLFKNEFSVQEVALLHGQMPAKEKATIMDAFTNGEIPILVATSVIEVGVDVPNASLMVIFDADHFGLSQLHQLRGRIGRGEFASQCILIANAKTDAAKARLEIITKSHDGFLLAQEDLKLRGEGDLFGKAQSGLPEFKVGNIVKNYRTLAAAKEVAQEIIKADPELKLAENQPLKSVLKYKAINQSQE